MRQTFLTYIYIYISKHINTYSDLLFTLDYSEACHHTTILACHHPHLQSFLRREDQMLGQVEEFVYYVECSHK